MPTSSKSGKPGLDPSDSMAEDKLKPLSQRVHRDQQHLMFNGLQVALTTATTHIRPAPTRNDHGPPLQRGDSRNIGDYNVGDSSTPHLTPVAQQSGRQKSRFSLLRWGSRASKAVPNINLDHKLIKHHSAEPIAIADRPNGGTPDLEITMHLESSVEPEPARRPSFTGRRNFFSKKRESDAKGAAPGADKTPLPVPVPVMRRRPPDSLVSVAGHCDVQKL